MKRVRARLKLRKVLVLHKKSTFQLQALERQETRFVKWLEKGDSIVTRVKLAHSEHVDSLEKVIKELERRKIDYRILHRSDLTEPVSNIDLMISVGGDGTFIDASHHLRDTPLLGVNSSLSSSFGHFCMANEKNFAQMLDQIESGAINAEAMVRLELTANGKLLPTLVLNEVLISHANPAATSRYIIEIEPQGGAEEQRSSGLWIGTAAGSTGSIRSAGGKVLPIIDQRYQLIVREPCLRPGESLRFSSSVLDPQHTIKLRSQMRTGAMFVDGSHISYSFYLGDELIIRPSSLRLNAFIRRDVNEIFGCIHK
jgi:NAD+ kinase